MKQLLIFCLAFLLALGFTACNKDEEDKTKPSSDEIVIAENVTVINEQTWDESFVSLDTVNYTLVFAKNADTENAFKQGDIVVSSNGEGLLRKVKAVNEVEGQLMVETDSAYITEVIENGEFEFNEALATSQIKSIEYHYPGMVLKNANLKSPDQTMLEWDFNVVLYDYDNNQTTTNDQIKILGDLSCNWNMAAKISVSWGQLKEARFGFESSEELNLKLLAGLEYSFEKKYTLATVNFSPITVFIGWVPIVFTPQMKIVLGLDGYANASITSEVSQSLTFNAGIRYTREQGWAPFQTFTKSLDFEPPQLNMNAGASAYLKPELNVKLYGIAGPYVNLKIYGKLEADLLETPWWEFSAGLNLNAGVKVSILDRFVLEYAVDNIIKYEIELAEATEPPVELAEVSTSAISGITQTSAVGGGNITNDGGGDITARGLCWGTSPGPTTAGSQSSNGTGDGVFSGNIINLNPEVIYYVRAYAINSAGTSYGNEVSFTTTGLNSVIDYDGNVYSTVVIGTQTWMKENLRTSHYRNGLAIPVFSDNTAWANLSTDAYCYYDNEANNANVFGNLYNWYAIQNENICPTGWHVPADAEWTVLTDYLGGENVAGGKMKEAGTSHWASPNTGADNTSGFTALPGGYRNNNGAFTLIDFYATWWTISPFDTTSAWYRTISYDLNSVYRSSYNKKSGFSVRCVKN